MKHLIFLLAVLVLTANFTFVNADTRSGNNELYPSSWDIELKEAKISGDKQKEAMLEQMIYEKTQHMITVPDMNDVDVCPEKKRSFTIFMPVPIINTTGS